jgi:hypothetical protein
MIWLTTNILFVPFAFQSFKCGYIASRLLVCRADDIVLYFRFMFMSICFVRFIYFFISFGLYRVKFLPQNNSIFGFKISVYSNKRSVESCLPYLWCDSQGHFYYFLFRFICRTHRVYRGLLRAAWVSKYTVHLFHLTSSYCSTALNRATNFTFHKT